VTTSAGDQINGALRLIGQLAEGETPSAATSADALTAMNQMLDSWSSERLSVFSTQDQVFTWPASTATRTLGPTGDFVGNRPVLVDDSTYFRDPSNNISFGIKLINQATVQRHCGKDSHQHLSAGHVCEHDNVKYRDDCLSGADESVVMAHHQRYRTNRTRNIGDYLGSASRLSSCVSV
jgi:hypothetical protein